MTILELLEVRLQMENSEYTFGGLDVKAVNVLRLISELEGSSQLLKYMGFQEDMETLNEIKKKYYKLYFKLKKEESNPLQLSGRANDC